MGPTTTATVYLQLEGESDEGFGAVPHGVQHERLLFGRPAIDKLGGYRTPPHPANGSIIRVPDSGEGTHFESFTEALFSTSDGLGKYLKSPFVVWVLGTEAGTKIWNLEPVTVPYDGIDHRLHSLVLQGGSAEDGNEGSGKGNE